MKKYRYEARVRGKKTLNGAEYCAVCTGTFEDDGEVKHTIFTILAELADHLGSENREMEFQSGIRVLICPADEATPAGVKV